jgi:RNA polymerase sigma-70 factor (ECF subfamily)
MNDATTSIPTASSIHTSASGDLISSSRGERPNRLSLVAQAGPVRSSASGRILSIDDVQRSMPRLRAAARNLTRSEEDAEDLLQDMLLLVFRRPRSLTNDDAAGYLVRALRNTWISKHRQNKRDLATEPLSEHYEPAATDSESDPSAHLCDREAWDMVKDLPTPYRDVIVSVVICGLSYRQAADALKVPIGTIMSRLYRARRLLPATLAEAS